MLRTTVTGEWVRVSVADQGPGVPPAFRNEIFRRFVYPTAGNDRTKYGAGLGLSVVYGIVQQHGGDIGVENSPAGGAVFTVTLPLESPEPASEILE